MLALPPTRETMLGFEVQWVLFVTWEPLTVLLTAAYNKLIHAIVV